MAWRARRGHSRNLPVTDHTRSVAAEVCDAVRVVSDFSAVVVLLQSEDGGVLTPAGWLLGGGAPGQAELTESASGSGPGARALALGVTLVYGASDNPVDDLPLWATARGFTVGLVMPLSRNGKTFGAVYALRREPQSPTDAEIHMAELAVLHGSRTLPVLVKDFVLHEEDEALTYTPSAQEQVRDLQRLSFEGLDIDPVREQAELGGQAVSLSRTEFLMLYTLGMQPGEIVPHHVLLEVCWPDDFPALSAVDATVYRLRKKLSLAMPGAGKDLVKTVRGKGYRLVAMAVEKQPPVEVDESGLDVPETAPALLD